MAVGRSCGLATSTTISFSRTVTLSLDTAYARHSLYRKLTLFLSSWVASQPLLAVCGKGPPNGVGLLPGVGFLPGVSVWWMGRICPIAEGIFHCRGQ